MKGRFIGYLIIWLCLFGVPKTLISLFLSFICIVVVYVLSRYISSYKLYLKYILYIPWLIKEIVLSGITVVYLIWSKKQISPTYGWIESKLDTIEKLVVYANSITLTPGTFTIDINNSKLFVHSLTKEGFESLKSNSAMERRIEQYFKT